MYFFYQNVMKLLSILKFGKKFMERLMNTFFFYHILVRTHHTFKLPPPPHQLTLTQTKGMKTSIEKVI